MYDTSVKRLCLEEEAATSQNEVFEIFIIKRWGRFMDQLGKYICEYVHLSLIIQTSLLALPYSPLLPSAQGRNYIYILAEELEGLDNVTIFPLTL